MSDIAYGTYTGTGAAQTVTIGFKPAFLILINNTDGDVVSLVHASTADDKNISIDTEVALEGSNGVTWTATGFTLGTGATVNESDKVFHYLAIGRAGLTSAGA